MIFLGIQELNSHVTSFKMWLLSDVQCSVVIMTFLLFSNSAVVLLAAEIDQCPFG